MYTIMYETSRQSRFDARYWMLGAGVLGQPRGVVWGRRREGGSGWGPRVYLWWIHFDVWQNQYNIVKFKNKIKLKKNYKRNEVFYHKENLSSKFVEEKYMNIIENIILIVLMGEIEMADMFFF